MAGCSGFILAVHTLGCARIFQMAPVSRIVGFNWTYRTTQSHRAQTGRAARERHVGEDCLASREWPEPGPVTCPLLACGHPKYDRIPACSALYQPSQPLGSLSPAGSSESDLTGLGFMTCGSGYREDMYQRLGLPGQSVIVWPFDCLVTGEHVIPPLPDQWFASAR